MASPAISIVSAMITPALLILGTGSLIATGLARLGRAVDRARDIIKRGMESPNFGISPEETIRWLIRYERRALLSERSIGLFFAAVACFVADSLAIAFDLYLKSDVPSLVVGLASLGAVFMFVGAGFMMVEAHMGGQQLHEEISAATKRIRSQI